MQARNPARGQQIYVKTGPNGEAGVTYNVGQLTEAREIVAEVRHEAGDTQYDFAIDRVTFNVNGRATPPRDDPADDEDDTRTTTRDGQRSALLSLGTAGDTPTLTVTAPATSLGHNRSCAP